MDNISNINEKTLEIFLKTLQEKQPEALNDFSKRIKSAIDTLNYIYGLIPLQDNQKKNDYKINFDDNRELNLGTNYAGLHITAKLLKAKT